jgi:hypothetical protein
MNRILILLLALVASWFAVRWVVVTLASDETKIRWLLERMEVGFNENRAGAAVSGLSDRWRHEDEALDRDRFRLALLQRFRDERDADLGRFPYMASIDPDTLAIDAGEGRGHAALELRFAHWDGATWRVEWLIHVEAELEQEDDGWRIVRSKHVDLAGRGLGR